MITKTDLASYAVTVFIFLPQELNGRLLELSQNNEYIWEKVVNVVVYGYQQNMPPSKIANSIKINWW